MKPGPVTVRSPAKLNLFLHITGRRDDGYHELQTLFQLVDLCDILHFDIPSTPGLLALHSEQADLPLQDNLVLRAARLLRDSCNLPQASASITVEKHIPMGSGLGGGSSNAAVTLVTLNRLWKTRLSKTRLLQLG
ncbi:MAG: 4-(cytidine 5'-diphospho)-2-C-methyl-D-erythritol kinase, partial [Pseudohongiellaceae bacterium]